MDSMCEYTYKNGVLTNADGFMIRVGNVHNFGYVKDNSDTQFIEISIVNNTKDTYENILKFLSGDISDITLTMDICMPNGEVVNQLNTRYIGYDTNINISYGRAKTKGYDVREEYVITCMKINSASMKARQTAEAVLTAHEAIVYQYETSIGG